MTVYAAVDHRHADSRTIPTFAEGHIIVGRVVVMIHRPPDLAIGRDVYYFRVPRDLVQGTGGYRVDRALHQSDVCNVGAALSGHHLVIRVRWAIGILHDHVDSLAGVQILKVLRNFLQWLHGSVARRCILGGVHRGLRIVAADGYDIGVLGDFVQNARRHRIRFGILRGGTCGIDWRTLSFRAETLQPLMLFIGPWILEMNQHADPRCRSGGLQARRNFLAAGERGIGDEQGTETEHGEARAPAGTALAAVQTWIPYIEPFVDHRSSPKTVPSLRQHRARESHASRWVPGTEEVASLLPTTAST